MPWKLEQNQCRNDNDIGFEKTVKKEKVKE